MATTPDPKQIKIRVSSVLYSALAAIAAKERRTVPQAARLLLEERLRSRIGGSVLVEDISSSEIAKLAQAAGSFDWLAEEPDIYNDSFGEPV